VAGAEIYVFPSDARSCYDVRMFLELLLLPGVISGQKNFKGASCLKHAFSQIIAHDYSMRSPAMPLLFQLHSEDNTTKICIRGF
jgi:hypothetical protein